MNSFDYTVSSTDYTHYNRIHTNLANPQTEFCKLTITSLTTMANIIVLNKQDYFIMNNVKYTMDDDFTEVSTSSLVVYLNSLVEGFEFFYDNCGRIYVRSESSLTLSDCSYNLKLLFGIINIKLPLTSTLSTDTYILQFPDVGMYLSTPVLYLASNIGTNSYKIAESSTSMRILMRISNSFFAKQPITATNGDYTTLVKCSDLSDVRFTLLDANYHELTLLSPMYLTVEIECIPDKILEVEGPVNPETIIPTSTFAYMRDLTERGQDVDESQLDTLIYVGQNMNEPK